MEVAARYTQVPPSQLLAAHYTRVPPSQLFAARYTHVPPSQLFAAHYLRVPPSQLDVRPTIVMTFEDWERMTDHGRSGALGSPSFTQMCLRLIVDPYEQKQIRKQHRHTSTRTSATLARTVR